MKQMYYATIVFVLILLLESCSGRNGPDGFYICQGPYKSLTFNSDGSVIVDLGFMKGSGTYDVKGENVELTLNGKSIVYTAKHEEGQNYGHNVLDGGMVGVCINKNFQDKKRSEFEANNK